MAAVTVCFSAPPAPGAAPSPAVRHVRPRDGAAADAWVHVDRCTDRWVATCRGLLQVTVAQLAGLLHPLSTGCGHRGDLPAR